MLRLDISMKPPILLHITGPGSALPPPTPNQGTLCGYELPQEPLNSAMKPRAREMDASHLPLVTTTAGDVEAWVSLAELRGNVLAWVEVPKGPARLAQSST